MCPVGKSPPSKLQRVYRIQIWIQQTSLKLSSKRKGGGSSFYNLAITHDHNFQCIKLVFNTEQLQTIKNKWRKSYFEQQGREGSFCSFGHQGHGHTLVTASWISTSDMINSVPQIQKIFFHCQKYAGTGENCNIAIPIIFYPLIKSL